MNLYQEYNTLINNYSFFEDYIKKILGIFEGTGDSQIINSDLIPPNFRIKDFIVISDQIDRGLNIVHKGLREIQEDDAKNSGYLFYFSQYGGSKTQFLNLIVDEINANLPNCVTVLFEDIHHVNPIVIFENIFSQIFHIIAKVPQFHEDKENYKKFSRELRQKIGEVQVAIRQSSNLKEAEVILDDLRRIKNPNMIQQINKLDDLLHSTILVDPLLIFSKIISLMQFCSQKGILFLFLFDEVDLWLDERGEDLSFSKDFNRISKIMKYMFEIPNNQIKNFIVFACTDRVNRLFMTMQHKFENISPVASRLNRIYNSADKVLEPGNYGPKIDKALINLAAFYHLANDRIKLENKLFEQALPILEVKYNTLSRRMANSKILQILKIYKKIYKPLETGLKEWKSNTQYYGTLIQKNLPSILNRLTIKFIREDTPVDPGLGLTRDKVDGYFVNYTLDSKEIRTYVEIKLTADFKGEKSYQALQFLQLHPGESIVLVLFTPTPFDKVKKEIYEYAENNGYKNEVYSRLYFIYIQNPFAFAPIIGITKVSGDTDKLLEFLEAYAQWLEFYGDFSSQYQEIKQKIGIDFIPPEPLPKPEGEPERPDTKPEFKLSTDQQTCLNLLSQLYHKHKFTESGRMYKSTIRKFIMDNSLGITDVEKYYEIMKHSNIIDKITDKTVSFSAKILKIDSLDKLRKIAINYFQKKEDSSGILGFSL